VDLRPAEVLRRNFWFCTIDDPSTMATRHRIGVENIMIETDYPHGDGTWPDTQAVIAEAWGGLPTTRSVPCAVRTRLASSTPPAQGGPPVTYGPPGHVATGGGCRLPLDAPPRVDLGCRGGSTPP